MDYEKLAEVITDKTKVIIPVDIAGIICDYSKIFEVVEAKKKLFKANNKIQEAFNRIIVMADSAHGFGAVKDDKESGEFADFTTFSFHAVKNLTTAEGGAVTWKSIDGIDDEEIYRQYQILSLHGQTKDALAKTKLGAWEYDIIEPAFKCNMTDINAAIGLAQLDRYDEMLKKRHEIISIYDKVLKDCKVKVLNHKSNKQISSGHLYLVRVNDISIEQRNEIIVKMAESGIATNVHYKPLPMLTAYKNIGFDIEDYPNAYDFYHNEITLPLYSKLTKEDAIYVIDLDYNITHHSYKKMSNVIYIHPKENIGSFLNFDHDQINKNIQLGYNDVYKYYNKYKGYKYTFNIFSNNNIINEFYKIYLKQDYELFEIYSKEFDIKYSKEDIFYKTIDDILDLMEYNTEYVYDIDTILKAIYNTFYNHLDNNDPKYKDYAEALIKKVVHRSNFEYLLLFIDIYVNDLQIKNVISNTKLQYLAQVITYILKNKIAM